MLIIIKIIIILIAIIITIIIIILIAIIITIMITKLQYGELQFEKEQQINWNKIKENFIERNN